MATELEHALEVNPEVKAAYDEVQAARDAWDKVPTEDTQRRVKDAEMALRSAMERFRLASRGEVTNSGLRRKANAGRNREVLEQGRDQGPERVLADEDKTEEVQARPIRPEGEVGTSTPPRVPITKRSDT